MAQEEGPLFYLRVFQERDRKIKARRPNKDIQIKRYQRMRLSTIQRFIADWEELIDDLDVDQRITDELKKYYNLPVSIASFAALSVENRRIFEAAHKIMTRYADPLAVALVDVNNEMENIAEPKYSPKILVKMIKILKPYLEVADILESSSAHLRDLVYDENLDEEEKGERAEKLIAKFGRRLQTRTGMGF